MSLTSLTILKIHNGNFTHNRGQNKIKGVALILGKANAGNHNDDNNDKRQIQYLFNFIKFYTFIMLLTYKIRPT
jgi:hypothetical protein